LVLNQDPKQVAAFVSECLDYRRFEAPDLDPYVTRETLQEMGLDDYRVDTFSSDYDDTFVDESGYNFSLMPMEPSVGSFTGAP
jgi:hypothetical protein